MKGVWTIVAALAALVSGSALAQTAKSGLNAACRVPGKPVHESGFVEIGGIRQWVVVEGQDCANPVILIVHGGPGNPDTPFADKLYGNWTRKFTLVHWDQRGSGKTYAASTPAEGEALTMNLMAGDGVAVARYAMSRLGKRKVILMGGSWGSALAVNMAMAAPDLFHAYIGTSQLVSYQDGLAVSYAETLKRAQAAGDADATGKLEKIGPPPWSNPRNSGILRRLTRKYEAMRTDPAPRGWFEFAPGYDTPDYQAAYEAGEEYSFLQFVGLAGDGMGPKIDLRKLGTRFAMPVYLLQGEEDLVTPRVVSAAYFNSIAAPAKTFVLLPRTGHDPNATMIDAQFRLLESKVRGSAMTADLLRWGSGRAARR